MNTPRPALHPALLIAALLAIAAPLAVAAWLITIDAAHAERLRATSTRTVAMTMRQIARDTPRAAECAVHADDSATCEITDRTGTRQWVHIKRAP